MARKLALLIGISNYPCITEARYAREDAIGVRDALHEHYGFNLKDEIVLMTCDQGGENFPVQAFIDQRLQQLQSYEQLDLLVIGFWGHGVQSQNELYLCAADTGEKDFVQKGIARSEVVAKAKRACARHTCIILDCCQSHGHRSVTTSFSKAERERIRKDVDSARDVKAVPRNEIQPWTFAIWNSCSPDQKAYPWDERQHGLFTAHLIEGLNQRHASLNGLADYVNRKASNTALHKGKDQTPFIEIRGHIPLPVVGAKPEKPSDGERMLAEAQAEAARIRAEAEAERIEAIRIRTEAEAERTQILEDAKKRDEDINPKTIFTTSSSTVPPSPVVSVSPSAPPKALWRWEKVPKNQTVWGIDIGRTSLKALRCCLAEEPGKVKALACDFIEHSTPLQPGMYDLEIFTKTLRTFLNRHVTKGDRIAISVPGQKTMSRFLPLPPVDPKKIPGIIQYEAKQWLPCDFNDVVFDFQPLGNPVQDTDDTFVDVTVGMFAIKRDVAMQALAPYLNMGINVDSIQSTQIALYNFLAFDWLPPPDDDTSQEFLITLCIGTDVTDVVIANGETSWIRSIPLGGNSFTKAMTRELQPTFSKAEYLKRNIATSKDVEEQKRVITAMRPVFNDMVNEVNRSLEYYLTLNRKAKFQKIIALGNAAKLPGLRQFIAQNLGYEVVRLNHFNNLTGTEVTATQLFRDNLHSFAVSYGLAVQQLGISSLKTNLIPRKKNFLSRIFQTF